MKSILASIGSPLALASYVAWGVVWVTTTGIFGMTASHPGWPAAVTLLIFLGAWITAIGIDTESPGEAGRIGHLHDACLVVLAVSALVMIAMGPSGTSPILLVLVATLVASRFAAPVAIGLLVAINAAFAALLLTRWDASLAGTAVAVGAYGAFQAFAALVLIKAMEAERLATELQRVNARLLATRSLLSETARDQERLRLSRELHDVAGHKLTALQMNLRALARQAGASENRELETASGLAGELLQDLRAVVRQLRQGDGIDLETGIRELAAPLPRPRVHLDLDDDARIPRAEQAETLLRMVQEGLTNAARHGRAGHAWIQLRRDGESLHLDIDDDGRVRWPVTPGNGLAGMRERLAALGGSLEIAPSEHGGLRLAARLPVEVPA